MSVSFAPASRPSQPIQSVGILSLGTKLALTTVAVLVLASLLVYFELAGRERRALVSAKSTAAAMVADLFAESLSAPLDFGDSDAVEAELAHVRPNADVTCAAVWLGQGGKPIARFDRGGCSGDAAPNEGDVAAPKILGDRVEVARAVVGRAGNVVGKALLVFSLTRENETFEASRARLFWVSLALALATAVLLIGLSRQQIVSPLGKLSEAARRVGRGDFDTRVEVASKDEIGQLAHAFNRMRGAIADREQRLEAATQSLRDLFDHMRQAILAFGSDGRVQGAVSRQAAKVFGRADLEGVLVGELLYGGSAAHDVDAQAFQEWMAMAFELPLEQWPDFAALAPREVTLQREGAEPLPLELEFRPVVKGGHVERVMLLATDVSEKKQLELTVQSQEEEHARRMAAMRRLIAGGGQVFVSFIDSAREKLARCHELVGPSPRLLRIGEIDELFRHVHTIKGEARAFDLRELEAETEKLEEELDELRGLARGEGFTTTGSVHGALTSRLARAEEALDRGREVFVAASPIGRAALDQVTVQRSDLEKLERLAERGDAALVRVVSRLASRPFGESTASLVDMVPTWGEKEGKQVRLDVDGRDVRVPPSLARVLGGALTHLVRNAIAHGIEPPDVRKEAGKDPAGVIHAFAEPGKGPDDGPTIILEDDGRGLDLKAIATRAAQLGVRVEGKADKSLHELVFIAGLSTLERAGMLAGRGVGLGAVKSELARAGYEIDVASEHGRFTRFVLRPSS